MGIIFSLFLGWFLGLFGFKGVVIAGMLQVFGIKITVLGYYFLFACLGVFGWVVNMFGRLVRKPKQIEVESKDLNGFVNEILKALKK